MNELEGNTSLNSLQLSFGGFCIKQILLTLTIKITKISYGTKTKCNSLFSTLAPNL